MACAVLLIIPWPEGMRALMLVRNRSLTESYLQKSIIHIYKSLLKEENSVWGSMEWPNEKDCSGLDFVNGFLNH